MDAYDMVKSRGHVGVHRAIPYPCALMTLVGICMLGGCAGMRAPITSYSPPLTPCGIVLVVDGAGGQPDAANAAVAAVRESGAPLYVRLVPMDPRDASSHRRCGGC